MTDIPTWWMKGDWFDLCSCKIPARAGLPKRKAIENEVHAFASGGAGQSSKHIPFDWTGPAFA